MGVAYDIDLGVQVCVGISHTPEYTSPMATGFHDLKCVSEVKKPRLHCSGTDKCMQTLVLSRDSPHPTTTER